MFGCVREKVKGERVVAPDKEDSQRGKKMNESKAVWTPLKTALAILFVVVAIPMVLMAGCAACMGIGAMSVQQEKERIELQEKDRAADEETTEAEAQ